MMTSIRTLRTAAAACVLGAGAAPVATAQGTATAPGTAPVEIRYASVAPQKSVWGMQIERSVAGITEDARGSLRYQTYYGGQLGGEAEIVQQVARGRLDSGGVGVIFLSTLVRELGLLLLPSYFTSVAELDCVLDGPLRATVADKLARVGVQFLGWGDAGSLQLVGKRAFKSPEDLRGLKAGSYGSRGGVVMWQGLGATAAPVSSPELGSAFQTGLVDVAFTVPVFYVMAGVNRSAPVITRGAFYWTPVANIMNKALWDRLTPEQRGAIERQEQRTPASLMRAEVREFEERMFAAHEKGGGTTVTLTPAQQDAYRTALAALWPKIVAESGPDGPAFFAQLEAARKACGGTR